MSGMAITALASMGGVTFGVLADTVVRAALAVRPARLHRGEREATWTRAEVDRLTTAAWQAGHAEALLGQARELVELRARTVGPGSAGRPATPLEMVRGELPEVWR